jgi:SAM-dependent methyltransferase
MTPNKWAPNWLEKQKPLQQWYCSVLGRSVLEEMEHLLERLLPDVFGYRGLQIGQLSEHYNLLKSAGLQKKLILGSDQGLFGVDVQADALHLPIASDTMSLVVLPHTLDFCDDPHQVLREADRVLSSDGHLLIIGFNPYSLMGLRHSLMRWRGAVPWNGQFYSRGRVADWLSLLSFRLLKKETFFLRVPISNESFLNKTKFIEKSRPVIGKLGGLYIMYARKQTIPLSAVRQKWPHKSAGVAISSLVRRSRANQRSSDKNFRK